MSVTSERLVQALNGALGADGWSDIRDQLPQHATKRYGLRPLEAVDGVAVHHTAGSRTGTPRAAADHHVDANNWPGIGYHFWVANNGHVFYVGSIDTERAHVLNQNVHLDGIVLAGNFEGDVRPSDAALAALANTIAALEVFHNRALKVDGHGGWMAAAGRPGYTECPGDTLIAALADIRARAGRPAAGTGTDVLVAFARDTRVLRLNRGSALQRAITAAGFLPVGNEGTPDRSPDIAAQLAEHPKTTEVRVFWFDRTTGSTGSLTTRPPTD